MSKETSESTCKSANAVPVVKAEDEPVIGASTEPKLQTNSSLMCRVLERDNLVCALKQDKWIRRKLRCYIWKQWGRSGYRQLRKRGVDRFLAWNTSKSAHGVYVRAQRFTKRFRIVTLGA